MLGRLLVLLFLTMREAQERAKLPARVHKGGRVFTRRALLAAIERAG